MKKITAIFADDAPVDIGALALNSVEFILETLPNEPELPKRSYKRDAERPRPVVIMEHFSPEATFTQTQAANWLQAAGYAQQGVSSALQQLKVSGNVRSLGAARWQFVKPLPTR